MERNVTHSILVIGGQATFRNKLASVLREAGFVVAAAPDYHGMLFNQNGCEPDLVIMDEVLLDEDAVKVCCQLRNSFGIPVILLGRDSSKEAWRRVTEAEIDYVLKPVTYRELIARVKAVLRRYETQQIPDLQSRLKLFRSDVGSTHEKEKVNSEHKLQRGDSVLLTSEDKADGFSIVSDESRNITLLKQGRPMAWFAATVTEEVIVAFLKLIRDSERSDDKQAGNK